MCFYTASTLFAEILLWFGYVKEPPDRFALIVAQALIPVGFASFIPLIWLYRIIHNGERAAIESREDTDA